MRLTSRICFARRCLFGCFIALCALPGLLPAQDIYKPSSVIEIRLFFKQADWDFRLDSLKQIGNDERLVADAVINGVKYPGVGVRYKGNSSYFSVRKSGSTKLPFNIKINFTDKKLALPGGYTSLKLANAFRDPSFIREVLAYDLAAQYMPAPKANFASLYINDAYIGLYSNTESIDTPLLKRYFDGGNGTLVKCDPANWNVVQKEGCPQGDHASLQYLGNDSTCYFSAYELEQGLWSEFIQLTKSLEQPSDKLESLLDMDQTLWMLVLNNMFVNLDSYLGKFCHNYYMYRDSSGVFHPLLWDLNMAFGGFRYAGSDEAALSDDKLISLSPFLHYREKNAKRPLILSALSDELRRKIYIAHFRTILEEQLLSGEAVKRARALHKLVEPYVLKDVNKLYDTPSFYINLDSTAKADRSNIIGISHLMQKRAAYLSAHPLFQHTPPSVQDLKHSVVGKELRLSLRSGGAIRVWLFRRNGKTGVFEKMPLFDDGQHGDGTAGDFLWGITIPYVPGMQFYVVTEDEKSAFVFPRKASTAPIIVK
jgi:hypothetical protein